MIDLAAACLVTGHCAERQPPSPSGGVFADVGQRLLDHPVGGQVRGRRQRYGGPRHLAVVTPTEGEALINGRRYADLEHPRRTVGAVLETTGFHPGRTGRDHLRVIAQGAGLDGTRVDAALERVGLAAAAGRRVRGYSLGMRQRLGLAAALFAFAAIATPVRRDVT